MFSITKYLDISQGPFNFTKILLLTYKVKKINFRSSKKRK